MEALGKKKGMLKNLILQLHKGAKLEEVGEKAKEVLKGLSAKEVAEVEQELIKEGIPKEEEIMKLCDIHMEVFKEALEEKFSLPEWHPVHTLLKEHDMLLSYAKNLEEKNLDEIEKHFREAEKHYLREENILFPYLEKHGIEEPPAIMWAEHDRIRQIKKEIINALKEGNENEFKEKAKMLYELLSKHYNKENRVLFPTALKVISDEEWVKIREEFDEIGYCCFIPPEMPKMETKERKMKEGKIVLPTGSFTKEELEAVLNSLPVDITFVDKNDEVRYFNETKDRVFVRTKTIIGRKVQQCHPQKSVHIVNKILEEFKKGNRDKAEFWIDVDGRKIYIRYFAVRKNGKYLGTIEVTQDITEIKKIEGEKRLLDWK
ncbi:MAG: DUF438 domain-containing protein [Thermoplasmata archaeon]|nr:DUF438 domain-containing protein [Thermoplasmata archaeon]